MRRFYIFNIDSEYRVLTRKSPYNLFKTFESIYYLKNNDRSQGYDLYKNITSKINRINLNNILFKEFKDDDHYSKFMNTHIYNNFYSDESSKLTIGNNYMVLESNVEMPTFFLKLTNNPHLFACDFKNKDYFWLESIA